MKVCNITREITLFTDIIDAIKNTEIIEFNFL